jgi:nicotinamide-nucleotide amidase
VFSADGATIDQIVAELLLGPPVRTVAVAESCTGGLMAGRLTDRAGSSAYVLGGVVVYSNEAKVAHAGVPAEVIERVGAVSPEVARALADGAAARFGADLGIGITGIAGPGGGTPEKPVGMVCVCVASGSDRVERTLQLPGDRATVRDRTTTAVMHLLRRLLLDAS